MTRPADPPAARTAAFVDVDNTLVRGSSLYHFARGLASQGLVHARELVSFAWQQLAFRTRGAESAQQNLQVCRRALSLVTGRSVEALTRACEQVYAEAVADRVWPTMRDVAHRHLERGEQVWLVTASPIELAAIMARELGFTGALGTVAEHRDGHYTGDLVGALLHGPEKARRVRALADARGFDLTRCAAYSDSVNDLPLLQAVGRPCAVNPDRALRRHAVDNSWPVLDFRTTRVLSRVVRAPRPSGGRGRRQLAAHD